MAVPVSAARYAAAVAGLYDRLADAGAPAAALDAVYDMPAPDDRLCHVCGAPAVGHREDGERVTDYCGEHGGEGTLSAPAEQATGALAAVAHNCAAGRTPTYTSDVNIGRMVDARWREDGLG